MEPAIVSLDIILINTMIASLTVLQMRSVLMDFANAHQDILELHWVSAFYNKLDLELAHQAESLSSANVYLQLFVVPTNIGVEVFALALMDTIELMANVSPFNLLMSALFILNQME